MQGINGGKLDNAIESLNLLRKSAFPNLALRKRCLDEALVMRQPFAFLFPPWLNSVRL